MDSDLSFIPIIITLVIAVLAICFLMPDTLRQIGAVMESQEQQQVEDSGRIDSLEQTIKELQEELDTLKENR